MRYCPSPSRSHHVTSIPPIPEYTPRYRPAKRCETGGLGSPESGAPIVDRLGVVIQLRRRWVFQHIQSVEKSGRLPCPSIDACMFPQLVTSSDRATFAVHPHAQQTVDGGDPASFKRILGPPSPKDIVRPPWRPHARRLQELPRALRGARSDACHSLAGCSASSWAW